MTYREPDWKLRAERAEARVAELEAKVRWHRQAMSARLVVGGFVGLIAAASVFGVVVAPWWLQSLALAAACIFGIDASARLIRRDPLPDVARAWSDDDVIRDAPPTPIKTYGVGSDLPDLSVRPKPCPAASSREAIDSSKAAAIALKAEADRWRKHFEWMEDELRGMGLRRRVVADGLGWKRSQGRQWFIYANEHDQPVSSKHCPHDVVIHAAQYAGGFADKATAEVRRQAKEAGL